MSEPRYESDPADGPREQGESRTGDVPAIDGTEDASSEENGIREHEQVEWTSEADPDIARRPVDDLSRGPRRASEPEPAEPDIAAEHDPALSPREEAYGRFIGIFRSLAHGWLLIAIVALASMVCGIVITSVTPKTYEATALVRVFEGPVDQITADRFDAQRANQTLALTYAAVLNSPSFQSRIAPQVGGGISPDVLATSLSATAVPETDLISISVTDGSVVGATRRASEIIAAFAATNAEDAAARASMQEERLRARISRIDDELAEGEDAALTEARGVARASLAEVLAADADVGGGADLAAPPQGNSDPVAPRPAFNLLVALIVGLIIGSALTWVGRQMDEPRLPAA